MKSLRLPSAAALLLGSIAISCTPKQAQPPTVSVADFQQLRWLEGTWRGSGPGYPAFFEAYRVLDDSTMLMKSFTDSTLSVVNDSSVIALRGGTVSSRSARSRYVVTELSAHRVRFVREGSTLGHTFERVSDDQWTATLHAADAGGRATVYQMRRRQR